MEKMQMVQEIEIEAPRQRVFQALTDPRELDRWWTSRAESRAESGGSFRYDWIFPNAPERDHLQQGTYTEVKNGSRLAYPWQADGVPTEVDFELTDAGEGTRLRMEHRGWRAGMQEAYERHTQGWGFFLGNLKSFLEEGVDRRAEALGMKVGG